jgi:hypothetical protein
MRFLPALVIFAAPLLAMEPQEDREMSEAERARAAEERAAKDATEKEYGARAEVLRRAAEQRSKWGMTEQELRRWIDELRSKSEEKRDEAMAAIKRANASLDDLLPLIQQALEAAERARGAITAFDLAAPVAGARTLFLGALGSGAEVISGSADGTDYTLKSLGEGKYELGASKRADDGRLMEKWLDKGTLKELQEKYLFLKAGLAIQVPAPPAPVLLRTASLELDATGTFQCVEWNGGGRVGVAVLAPSEDLRFHLELPEGAGFIVRDVVEGSRAEQIGIRRMDILLRLDGELIDSPIQLKKLHEKTGVLEIIRRSETKKIDLAKIVVEEEKPAEAPAPVEVAPSGAR